MPTDERLANRIHRYAGVSAAISVGVGLVVLVGWLWELDALKALLPGDVTMKANTALGFVLLGTALWLLRDEAVAGRARLLGQTLGAIVAVFAALTLAEYVFGVSLRIDGLFADPGASAAPGRPGPHTAVALFTIGVWMVFLPVNSGPGLRVRYSFGVLSCIVVFQALIGLLFHEHYLSGTKTVAGMAVPTMLTAVVLCAGVLAARPRQGFMGVMTSTGIGGRMVRRLFPAVVVLPLLLAYLRLAGQEHGWYGTRDGVAILAGTTVILVGAIAFITARALNRTDLERARLEARLRQLADRDPMTDLYNRRGFENEANRHLALAHRYGERVAIIALDVDGLKQVNDTHGHAAGDELLIALTRRWSSALRASDAFARLGGDEFAVLLPQTDRAGSEELVAAKLLEIARTTVLQSRSSSVRTTASAGIAVADSEPFDTDTLLVAADDALYRAKGAGGDRYIVSQPAATPALR
jgi:diguanylate cyclase (GGDEF)-like protein